jgi:multidrug resistance efflux pump
VRKEARSEWKQARNKGKQARNKIKQARSEWKQARSKIKQARDKIKQARIKIKQARNKIKQAGSGISQAGRTQEQDKIKPETRNQTDIYYKIKETRNSRGNHLRRGESAPPEKNNTKQIKIKQP